MLFAFHYFQSGASFLLSDGFGREKVADSSSARAPTAPAADWLACLLFTESRLLMDTELFSTHTHACTHNGQLGHEIFVAQKKSIGLQWRARSLTRVKSLV